MNTPPTFPRLMHGGDYNPEQWPADIWDEDVRLMREAHVNVATLPVFGWVSLQPDEDTFTFEWLDTVIDKLWAGGVSVCLATATASQPAWLDRKYPDVLTVGADGVRRKHGKPALVLPLLAELPALVGGAGAKTGRAVRPSPGPGRLARRQRVRRDLLLQPVRRGVPRVAANPLRQFGGSQRPLVHDVLGAHVHGLVTDRDADPERRTVSTGTLDRL